MVELLLIEDDQAVQSVIEDYLTEHGFRVTAATTLVAARKLLTRTVPQIVLLDVLLPDGNGLDLLPELRNRAEIGVIVLTVQRSPAERVTGLDLGADDYIAKPFNMRELLARVQSLHRRLQKQGLAASALTGARLGFEGFVFDAAKRIVLDPDGKTVPLTSGEFDLLRILVQAQNNVVARDALFQETRQRSFNAYDRSIDVQIGRLRRKLERGGHHADMIKTIRGIGYVFTPTIRLLNAEDGST